MNKTILVVEDDARNRKLTCALLAAWGYTVVEALNGREGLAQAQATRPALILMDLRMPVMDGLSAVRAIREDPNLRTTPVIMLTSSAMKGDAERVINAGCNEYCSKPFDILELRALIDRYLLKQNAP